MIERALEKIEKLKTVADWHEDTLKIFDEWIKQLKELQMNETIWELPQIQNLASSIGRRIESADEELKTNRSLSDKERTYLFAIKDISEVELAVLSKQSVEKAVKQIERDADFEMAPYKKDSKA